MQTHKGKPNAKKKERQSLVVEIDSESEDKNLLDSIPPPPPLFQYCINLKTASSFS